MNGVMDTMQDRHKFALDMLVSGLDWFSISSVFKRKKAAQKFITARVFKKPCDGCYAVSMVMKTDTFGLAGC
ncbi:hypothetical protein CHS0354_007433 [Potamilus streckersoni]|uniref:Uncharacterized protein n=1 Tax=Potamilus streckersoni TaxID=2493646 RepID=A0AAE0W1Q1_9BIVA|nr:hypothetical protein CHS0354_007433 [Potamilus streckersoni]